MRSRISDEDEAENDAAQTLTSDYIKFGVFVLIVVGVNYLVGLLTGSSVSLKDFWWLLSGPAFIWLNKEFGELRIRTKQMNAKLSSLEERLHRIERQQVSDNSN